MTTMRVAMSRTALRNGKLTLAGKLARLGNRLRQPEWRRYGQLLFAGKVMGVAIVLLFITVVSAIFLIAFTPSPLPLK